jgi:hypothetical protein
MLPKCKLDSVRNLLSAGQTQGIGLTSGSLECAMDKVERRGRRAIICRASEIMNAFALTVGFSREAHNAIVLRSTGTSIEMGPLENKSELH